MNVAKKGKPKIETKSLLIAAQNNAIRTNHIKARIDKTQPNSRCRLCGDRDETINHIISECSKFSQKEYKSRHDWVDKGIHWELCNLNLTIRTNVICITQHCPGKSDAQTTLGFWDTYVSPNLGQMTRPYNNQQKKKKKKKKKRKRKKENLQNCELCCLGWPRSNIERKWKEG